MNRVLSAAVSALQKESPVMLLIALQQSSENNRLRGLSSSSHGTQIEVSAGDGGRTRPTRFPLVLLLTGLPVPAMCHGVDSFFVLSFFASMDALGIHVVDRVVAFESDIIYQNEQ